jgi:radical SAM-linked protein
VTRKFLVREKLKADRAAITDDCRLEDICFSCGVSECPQRPWVKAAHAPIDVARAHATTGKPHVNGFGRRGRKAAGGGMAVAPVPRMASAPLGVSSSTRFRIQFEKSAVMRFTSHLDLMRAWERTLRRSDLPLAFTQGHHPHLKMSFGPPLPLGHRSRAEVFDLEFTRPPGVDLQERLNAVLPEGLRVLSFRPILFKTPSLMSQLEGASYRVRFPGAYLQDAGVAPGDLLAALHQRITELLSREHVIVHRRSEEQAREFDARPSIVALEAGSQEFPATLDAHLRFTPRAVARPEELVALLIPTGDSRTLDVERTGLWSELGGHRLDPLALLSPRS